MKKLLCLALLIFLSNCESDDTINNCNFLIDIGVNATINLNLPEFSQLMFTSNVVYVANQGNAGIYVINVGNNNYRAWDAADPNRVQQPCSFLQRDGVEVMSTCPDGNRYNLYTGESLEKQLPCVLKEYRVTLSGANIVVSN